MFSFSNHRVETWMLYSVDVPKPLFQAHVQRLHVIRPWKTGYSPRCNWGGWGWVCIELLKVAKTLSICGPSTLFFRTSYVENGWIECECIHLQFQSLKEHPNASISRYLKMPFLPVPGCFLAGKASGGRVLVSVQDCQVVYRSMPMIRPTDSTGIMMCYWFIQCIFSYTTSC